ncbi:MAG TPA: MFS transporter [Candidatus Eremiobacteraceae bacterium]|nr:MFS transporter [Candidatus Eremiobacteraceae bacterium]
MSSVARAQGIFASRSFSLFYAGQALSYVGDGLRTLAIPLLVYHVTGSALSLGVTYALEFLPFALFGPIGGALADRLDRRRLMLLCDFVRFSVLVLFAFAYARGVLSLTELYIGIAIIATCAAFFVGGQSPSITYLLGPERASPAVAALIAAESGSQLFVPPIGGALFALVGPLPALAINAFTYLTSQLSLYALPTLGPDSPGRVPSMRELIDDISEGFQIVLADAAMRAVALLSCALNFFGIMAFAAIIPFLERDLGASTTQVGIAFGVIASGSMIGSLVAARFGRRWPFGKSLVTAYAIDAFIFLPVIFAHELWFGVAFFAMASACGSFEIAQIVAWRIRVAPPDKVGRVSAAVRLIALIGLVPGTLIGGSIAQVEGARDAMIVSAIGWTIAALYAAAIKALRREAR